MIISLLLMPFKVLYIILYSFERQLFAEKRITRVLRDKRIIERQKKIYRLIERGDDLIEQLNLLNIILSMSTEETIRWSKLIKKHIKRRI